MGHPTQTGDRRLVNQMSIASSPKAPTFPFQRPLFQQIHFPARSTTESVLHLRGPLGDDDPHDRHGPLEEAQRVRARGIATRLGLGEGGSLQSLRRTAESSPNWPVEPSLPFRGPGSFRGIVWGRVEGASVLQLSLTTCTSAVSEPANRPVQLRCVVVFGCFRGRVSISPTQSYT